jgi:uncharacterized protein YndB with AHSA1/START domain
MSMDTRTFTFERSLRAPIRQVYHAFTNGSCLREWFCNYATTEPRPGGRIYLAWNEGFYMVGQFIRTDTPHSAAFTWFGKNEPGPSEVAISLDEQDGVTHLRLEHREVGQGPEWESTIPEIEKGWNESLENLVSTLETGLDLRFVNRPMLGITFSDFSPEIAAALGVPVSVGIRIDEPVAGMGAAKAGLQASDVIVAMDGKPAIDFSSLTAILQSHKAGDVIDVTFYRGPQQMTLPMQLSRRPLLEIPPTPAGLAEALRPHYTRMASELAELFAGVSDEAAGRVPAPGEWSAKEVLAHLIHGERGWQNFVDGTVGMQEAQYDDFGGNIHARTRGTVQTFGTAAALLTELERAGQETIAFFANLPPEFVARKASYWRTAYAALSGPYHYETHMEQMRAALGMGA